MMQFGRRRSLALLLCAILANQAIQAQVPTTNSPPGSSDRPSRQPIPTVEGPDGTPRLDLPYVDRGQEPPGPAGAPGRYRPDARMLDDPSHSPIPAADAYRYRPITPGSADDLPPPLTLQEVLEATDRLFPLLLLVLEERAIAEGDILSALGAFDYHVAAENLSEPTGFYENQRNGFWVQQQTANQGIRWHSGYRIGRGSFPVWYGNRETNDGGEFRSGMIFPLLRNRLIDRYRGELTKSILLRQLAEPVIQEQRIEFLRTASVLYWDWVEAGQLYQINRSLLDLALDRKDALEAKVREQVLGAIELVDNERQIADREAMLIAAERKLQEAAYKLSLFFRDSAGNSIVPPADRLLGIFPQPVEPNVSGIERDIRLALELRPTLRALALQRERARVDLALANNLMRPVMDAELAASQDVGGQTRSRDKQQFELHANLIFEMPVQRREARGRIMATQARIRQIALREQFTRDKTVAEVRDAISAVDTAYRSLGVANRNTQLNRQLEEAERVKLFEGASNLLNVNIRELATADAAFREVDAIAEYFRALAQYRAALSLDTLNNANLPADLLELTEADIQSGEEPPETPPSEAKPSGPKEGIKESPIGPGGQSK